MKYRADTNNEPTKEVRQWNGIPLNITTRTGESRFSFSPPMTCDYGCIRGSWGAGLDGKALDVYVIGDAPTVFRVVQITPAGAIDEYKYVLGAQNFDEAVETFLKHVPRQLFGAASQYSIGQLQDDIVQQSKMKKDADELTEFVEQLEALIESDDAYSSNVYVLSFEVASDGDITGKFKDAWNGRVFAYSVEKNRIGYKPALTLDRADSATAAKLFDIFSSGYTSLQVRQDAVKSGKKPRCTAISYGCGRACIQLQNTCWINSSGQKVKKAGGSVASISQGRIDKLRVLARYLAANGNNKWSKYGGAELLAAKAGDLEAKRANLFAKNVNPQKASAIKKEPEFDFPPYDAKTRKIPLEYKQIGDGISGEVYLDKRDPQNPKALKYTKDTSEPLTIGVAKTMGDLGIAPKVYGSIFKEGKVNAIAMEYLDGYKTFGGGDEVYNEQNEGKEVSLSQNKMEEEQREKDGDTITKNILKITKIAHDNGFVPQDVHAENLMYNPKTLDVKFIDIDDSAKSTYKAMATQLLSYQDGLRPMLAQMANLYASKQIPKKDHKEFKKVRDTVIRSLSNQGSRDNPAASPDKAGKDNFSEAQYKEMVEKAYKLLGIN